MGNVVVVGSSNTDMVLNVPDFPAAGQTIAGSEFNITGGGKGANQVVAAAKALGDFGKVSFIACVGDDSLGTQAIESYKTCGIVTDYITIEKDTPSGVALIFVADSGENSIGINPGANGKLSPVHIDKAARCLRGAAVMLTQLESPIETVLYALKQAKSSGVMTILNTAPAYELPTELFEYIDYMTPNQTETEFYTGIYPEDEKSAAEAGRKLHEKGVGRVIITMGSLGSFYSDGKAVEFIRAKKVRAVDTVAAGDTFNGAFAAGIARGQSDVEALKFASAAAALAVTRRGAQESTPELSEIEEFL